VPSTARLGTSFARFRLSTVGGLKTTGVATDGEVEDYAVLISPPSASSAYFSDEHVINSANGFSGSTATFGDLDRDGDIDYVATLPAANQVVCFLNDGSQNFPSQIIVGTSPN